MRKTRFFFVLLFIYLIFARTETKADPPAFEKSVEKIKNMGLNVTYSHETQSESILYFVEDAHCNYTAQQELSAIVDSLVRGKLASQIAVEGSQGEILTQLFASFPNKKTRQYIADNLLKSSFISGEEYFSIYNGIPLRIYGVDEENLYRENIRYFRNSCELNRKSNELVKKIRGNILFAEEQTFNQELRKLSKMTVSYRLGKTDLDEYLNFCSALIKNPGIIKKYTGLKKFSDICAAQKKFDYDKLDTQTEQLLNFINKNLPADISSQTAKLYYMNVKGEVNSALFYDRLINYAGRSPDFSVDDYPLIRQFIKLSRQAESIDKTQLFLELDLFIDECHGIIAQTAVEKELIELDKKSVYLEKMINLTLTRREYEKVKEELSSAKNFSDTYNNLVTDKLPQTDIDLIQDSVNNSLAFYQTASKRDEFLFSNTLRLFESDKSPGIILIAGGFHKDKIIADCAHKGISCIVISPKNASAGDSGLYATVLLRSDLTSTGYSISNPSNTNLRATSFFAEHSFDDINKVIEFRNKFIFSSIAESLTDFSSIEVYNLIKDWRTAFSSAIEQRFNKDSQRYKISIALFDHLVTDVFSFGNFKTDPETKSITINSMGKLLRIYPVSSGKTQIEEIADSGSSVGLESAMVLKDTPVKLKNTQVFISSWTIADSNSPYSGHGDAHYSIKYIQALNKRSIEPTVILPENNDELQKTLKKYKSAMAGGNFSFRFAMFDSSKNQFVELDINANPIGLISISKKPVVIQLCSKIDPANDDRIKRLNNLLNQKETPLFIRIPTAGTNLSPIKAIDEIELNTNPAPISFRENNFIQTGFTVDQELLDLIGKLKSQPKDKFRENILDRINTVSGNNLAGILQSANIAQADIISQTWNFRYLTDISDAELSYFMNALSSTGKKQVLFTFYSDKSAGGLRHKQFLKRHFSFIDLQQANNNNINNKSNITVINLPPLDSLLFKSLMSISDNAVVSGENSLVEGIIINKFGLGPAILFKPAMQEHMSIIRNAFESNGQSFLLKKMESYSGITDSPSLNYLDLWQATAQLNESEKFIRDAFFDPQTNLLLRKATSDIVPPVNGLNTLTGIIDDIDRDHAKDKIINEYNLGTQNRACELVNVFMMDKSANFASIEGQDKFISNKLTDYLKDFVMSKAGEMIPANEIQAQVSDLLRLVSLIYRNNLISLKLNNADTLSKEFDGKLNKLYSLTSIVGNTHLFIPVSIFSPNVYEHIFTDRQSLAQADITGKPKTEIISRNTAIELIKDISEMDMVKNLINYIENSKSQIAMDFAKSISSIPYYELFLAELNLKDLPSDVIPKNNRDMVISEYKSRIVLHEMRALITKYSNELRRFYLKSDISTFTGYIKQVVNQEIPYNEKLSQDFARLSKKIQKSAQTDTNISPPFFSDYTASIAPVRDYIRELIIQKIAVNDYSINIRSIGSTNGKEAYSISAILEQELLSFAEMAFSSITDKARKNQMIDEWVNNWNVNVYAIDTNFSRLSATQLGIFTLDTEEQQFFSSHPEFERMFSDKVNNIARANDRLRRWIRPVYADLNTGLSVLNATKSEISFMTGFLPSLRSDKQRQKVIEATIDSSNRNYKSYFSYNTDSAQQAHSLGFIKQQPQAVPPFSLPDFTDIHRLTLYTEDDSIENLSRIFGLPEKTITDIYDPQLRRIADTLISVFYEFHKDHFTTSQGQADFIYGQHKVILQDKLMEMLEIYNTEHITNKLTLLQKHLVQAYRDKLIELNTVSTESYVVLFEQNLAGFNKSIQFTSTGHLFLPLKAQPDLYDHCYFDNQAFIPIKDPSARYQVETVSAKTKSEIIKDYNDIVYIRELLDFVDIKKSFEYFHSELLPPTYDPRNHLQIDKVKDYVALSCLDYFRAMVDRHSAKLIKEYGRADLSAFYEYIQKIKSGHKDDYVLNDFVKISAIVMQGNGNSVGTTNFFRSSEDWIPQLEKYLNDLVPQKVSRGDFSLAVRSIGGAIGKEGYSIAAVVEQTLLKYAKEKVFNDVTDTLQQIKLVKQWVDKWDVKVYVFDFSMQRLTTAKEGLYIMDDTGLGFIDRHKVYMPMIAKQYPGDGYYPMAKMPVRLRRWVTPIYCDFNDDLSPVNRNKAEITFAMNVLPYLKDKPAVIKAIENSVNPAYKSFFSYNNSFNDPPVNHKKLLNQPQVIPPAEYPDLESIINLSVNLRTSNPDKIASVIGLRADLVESLYNQNLLQSVHSLIAKLNSEYESPESEDAQIGFIDDILHPFMTNYIISNLINFPQGNINPLTSQMEVMLRVLYSQLLIDMGVTGHKTATDNFSRLISDFFASIELADQHLFVPVNMGNKTSYEHIFLDNKYMDSFYATMAQDIIKAYYDFDWDPQSTLPEHEEFPVSETVSDIRKTQLISEFEELRYATYLLDLTGYNMRFPFFPSDILPLSYLESKRLEIATGNFNVFKLPPQFIMGGPEFIQLKKQVATLTINYFRSIARKYSNVLVSPDIKSLYEFVSSGSIATQDAKKDCMLIQELFSIADPRNVITNIFRENEFWLNEFEEYMDDLIVQKIAAGDFTISVKSIGCSIGKETYSIGAVIERALENYARNHIAKDIADKSSKKKLIQQWIDKWDVKLYAMDLNYPRLITAREGNYLIGDKEIDFLNSHSHYKRMFKSIISPAHRKKVQYVKINDRLRRWLIPFAANLSYDSSVIDQYKTEITFAMNILPYIKDKPRETAVELVMASNNPDYKSFIAYNRDFFAGPINLEIIDHEPYTTRPAKLPDLSRVYNLSLSEEIIAPIQLAKILGISQKQLFDIYGFHTFYQSQILIDNFMRIENSDFISEQSQDKFLNTIVLDFIREFAVNLGKSSLKTTELKSNIDFIRKQIQYIYAFKLREKQIPDSQKIIDSFNKKVDAYFNSVEIIDNSHFFIPYQINGVTYFDYYYLEPGFFNLDYTTTNSISINRQVLTPQAKEIMSGSLKDKEFVKEILNIPGYIDFNAVFEKWHNREADYRLVGYLFNYKGTANQIELLKDEISFILIDKFRSLANKYSPELNSLYGKADLESLVNYLKFDLDAYSIELLEELESIRQTISSVSVIGATWFFRESDSWLNKFSDYLKSLIAQKIAGNDFNITVSSIGSSYGKEPYSIAAAIELALHDYAMNFVFSHKSGREQAMLIQQWINKWNVNVYAIDKDLQKLVTTREGIYLVSEQTGRPNEYDFFENHPKYKQMFSDRQDLKQKKEEELVFKNFAGRIKTRLRNWVKPVLIDLASEADLFRIQSFRSEAIFAMNSIGYLSEKEPQKAEGSLTAINRVEQIISQSFNPVYKSFFVHGVQINSKPETFNHLNGQPYTLPAKTRPDIEKIDYIASTHNIENSDSMLNFLGLNEDINGLVNLYFQTSGQIDKIISDFVSLNQNESANPLIQKNFIDNTILRFIEDIIIESIENRIDSNSIRQRVEAISKLFTAKLQASLKKNNIKNPEKACPYFTSVLASLYESVEFTSGNAFIPFNFEGRDVYKHIYILQNNFHPDKEKREASEVVSEFISSKEKRRIIDELSSLDLAKKLIGDMHLESFTSTDPELAFYNQYNPNNPGHRKEIADDIARFSIPYFLEVASKYSDTLFARYGIVDLRSLADYVDYLLKTEDFENPVLLSCLRITSVLQKQDKTIGATLLFRSNTRWIEDTEDYLNDIIAQKTTFGDYTLTIRDIGSSIGKEAYSIAATIEQALIRFAQANLYTEETNFEQRNRLIQNWIDNWDIKIFAFDLDFQRLINVKNGIFIIDDEEKSFLEKNPQFKGMFSQIIENTAVANNRLRKWMNPVYIDLDTDINMLYQYPGEITFALNLMKYLKSPDDMINTIKNSTNHAYKSLVVYNRKSFLPPEEHNIFENQPLVLPPKIEPDVNSIVSFSEKTGITSTDSLSLIFGLTNAQLTGIFESTGTKPFRKNFDAGTKSKQFIESMI